MNPESPSVASVGRPCGQGRGAGPGSAWSDWSERVLQAGREVLECLGGAAAPPGSLEKALGRRWEILAQAPPGVPPDPKAWLLVFHQDRELLRLARQRLQALGTELRLAGAGTDAPRPARLMDTRC